MDHSTIAARRLITDIGVIEFPVLTLAADGTLADISSDPRACADEVDTLTAAFLDVHTHGAVGYDVMTAAPAEFRALSRFLGSHGVAYYLPTTVTAPVNSTLRALESLADAIEAAARQQVEQQAPEAQPIGIHLEGPFLSHARRGVHPAADLQPASIELFGRFQQAARGHIRLITLAPEIDGALDLIGHATRQGVRVSLGHSDATAAETQAAIEAGATSATHAFNAMRPLGHREPGILGTVLDDDRVFAELICDGVHVAPPLVRLWLKAKGGERGILVTDAMSATGMPDGAYALAGLPVLVASGKAVLADSPETLAGSVLTLDAAVNNCQRFTGCSLADATRLASHNPAAMLGRPELTRLAPGSPANLNRFNPQGKCVATYLRGRRADRG